MRFYDVTSLLDRRKALADLYEDQEHSYLHAAINPHRVQNIWSRLPHDWRKDKEFVLTVLRITAPPSSSVDEEENNNDAAADTDSDDDDDENDDDAVSMAGSTAEITAAAAAAAAAAAVVVPLLPSKSEFERLFPQALRFDRDVVLAWATRRDFPSLFRERHLFLPPCLANDKEVCMEYCRQIPRSLQDCSPDLCNDSEVVSVAIEGGQGSKSRDGSGLELQYASSELQQNEEIVRKACRRNGNALMFCPPFSEAFQNITHDRNFMLNVVLGGDGQEEDDVEQEQDSSTSRTGIQDNDRSVALDRRRKKRKRGGDRKPKKNTASSSGPMWKLLDRSVREMDGRLVLAAVRNGLALRDVPNKFVTVPFLKQALTNKSVPLYLELSSKYQAVPELAVQAVLATDSTHEVHKKAFEMVQKHDHNGNTDTTNSTMNNRNNAIIPFRDNRDVIIAICERGSVGHIRELLGNPPMFDAIEVHHDRRMLLNHFAQLMELANNGDGRFPANNANANANANNVNINENENANANNDNDNDDGLEVLGEERIEPGAGERGVQQVILPPPPPAQPPSRFLGDFGVMTLAVARDPRLFCCVSDSLKENIGIILASIADGPSAWTRVKTIPWNIQRENPVITLKCLKYIEQKNLQHLPNFVPDDVWMANRALRLAWIRRKGFILNCFLPGLTTDEGLALEVAKYNWNQLGKVGETFLSDKQFVLKAVELDGRNIRHIRGTRLRTDFEVLTVAVANYYNRYDIDKAAELLKHPYPSSSEVKDTMHPRNRLSIPAMKVGFRDFCDIDQLKEIFIRKLKLHKFYLLDFLRGIAIPSSQLTTTGSGRNQPVSRSNLTMLDRGEETSEAFKRLIGEYLAVPIGKEVTFIRKALDNINRPNNYYPIGSPTLSSEDLRTEREREVLGVELPLFPRGRRQHLRLFNNNNDINNFAVVSERAVVPRQNVARGRLRLERHINPLRQDDGHQIPNPNLRRNVAAPPRRDQAPAQGQRWPRRALNILFGGNPNPPVAIPPPPVQIVDQPLLENARLRMDDIDIDAHDDGEDMAL